MTKLTFKTSDDPIVTIKQGEAGFMIQDGVYVSPRAGFEISADCPVEYKDMIIQAMGQGWLEPVAYLRSSEKMMAVLSYDRN